MLTVDDARKLGTRVAKESEGIVRFGITNGRHCLHIRCEGQSNTIYTAAEWDAHRFNRLNRKREKRADRDVLDAVANKEAA
jgi:hypothetical protein